MFEGDVVSNMFSSTSYVGWTCCADDLRIRRLKELLELVVLAPAVVLELEALYAHFPQRGFQQWLVFMPLNSAELT